MKTSINDTIKAELNSHASPAKKKILQGFFKTGEGEYGYGDVFIGVVVPTQRSIAKKYYRQVSLRDVEALLPEPVHEYRLTALYILTLRYENITSERDSIVELYLRNTQYINNWDLVDASSPKILGPHLLANGERAVLYDLARSGELWKQRIAMMATLAFIRANQYEDALKIAELLLRHKHDLIHKAVGWMLREIGKRDMAVELAFLARHYREMPRTMLRYAIEKFNPDLKEKFMKGEII